MNSSIQFILLDNFQLYFLHEHMSTLANSLPNECGIFDKASSAASIRFTWLFNGKMMVFDTFPYFISLKQIPLLSGTHCASGSMNTHLKTQRSHFAYTFTCHQRQSKQDFKQI